MDSNTVAIVGSVVGYPHGAHDDVQALAKLAQSYDCSLHVDSCLGSFVVGLMDEMGYKFPVSDFRVPGVTTISCDTHKYGFTSKGSSICMFRNEGWRKHAYTVVSNWSGGLYGTPSIAGSRGGGVIASTWATMKSFGKQGYVQQLRQVMEATREIKQTVKDTPGLVLMGDTLAAVLAWTFEDPKLSIFWLHDLMRKRGWAMGKLQKPPGMHIAVTWAHVFKNDDGEVPYKLFISDLKECTAQILEDPTNPEWKGGAAALYGVACNLDDFSQEIKDKLLQTFVETMNCPAELGS